MPIQSTQSVAASMPERMGRAARLVFLCLLALLLGPFPAGAGWFAEHKLIGDEAFRWLLAQPGVRDVLVGEVALQPFASGSGAGLPIPYRSVEWEPLYRNQIALAWRDTFGFTYGDLTGLSGDHGVDPQQLADALMGTMVHDATSGRQELVLPLMSYGRVAFASLEKSLLSNLYDHRLALEKGERGANLFEIPYLLVAKEDEGHFYRAGLTMREQLANTDSVLLGLLYRYFFALDSSVRGELVDRLFRANALSKYAAFHLVALEFARQAGAYLEHEDLQLRGYGRRQLVRALFYNSFADHYLQDCFASGHLVVSRSQCHALDDNGLHDYYSRVGLDVRNAEGDRWRAYGDRFYDSATYRRAINANKVSLGEVWGQFTAARDAARAALADEDVDQPVSLLEHLLKTRARNPADTMQNAFGMCRLIPIPFTPEEIEDIVHFADSRNGAVYALSVQHGFEGEGGVPRTLGRAHVMFGNSFVKPAERGCCAEHESYVWGGFGISGAFELGSRGRWFDLTGGVEAILNDAFSMEVNLGNRWREGTSAALFSPAVGYELKPLSWSFAPSLKLVAMYAANSLPMYAVQVEVRYY